MANCIDFHCHILPGIDDGSKNPDMTREMLNVSRRQGIGTVVATPHFYADSMRISGFLERRKAAYEATLPLAEAAGIRIIPGAEVAFFPGISRAEGIDRLTIGDTGMMLIEMPFRAWSGRDLDEVERILQDMEVCIAHLERFYQFQTDKGIIPALLEMPVCVQVNAECLLDRRTRKIPLKLFKNGQAHLLGSDCHNLESRPQNLAEGRAVIAAKCGAAVLEEIDALGEEILEGE
ncbi:MAG: capsular polysaccharide biosynthesis protein [Clostridia bacterium]|nr:capsular polysaccharide biosynthesis protein [Clostridia bacterium]